MGKKKREKTFYTESGFNFFPRLLPPLPFSKRKILETRLGVIVAELFMCMKSISFLQYK